MKNDLFSNPKESIVDFANQILKDDTPDMKPYAYIARASEEQPAWCCFIMYEDSNGEKYCGGHFPLRPTDMEDLLKLFDQFSKDDRKIVVDTEGYFESTIINTNKESEENVDGEKYLPCLVEFDSTHRDKYKLTKDALFLAFKEIKYKNEVYDGCLALHFEYSFFNDEGKEVFLHSPEGQPDPGVRFHIDKENGYRAEYVYENDSYPAKFEGVHANIWKDNMTPVTIPFNDAINLLKENFLIYDDTDNKPAQSTCYSTRKIEF